MKRKISLVKGQGIFIADILLVVFLALVVWSGLALHMTTHQRLQFGWASEIWSYIHIVCGLLLSILIFLHIKSHLNWFKGLFKRGLKNKSIITILVSVEK